MKQTQPKEIIIVGAGNRAMVYSKFIASNPSKAKIVGVVDPNPDRRDYVAKLFSIDVSQCFKTVDDLVTRGKIADAIINGTMDQHHLETSLPLLKLGYDMLLEKPFVTNEDDMWELVNCVQENVNKVMICHVLRYTPFYSEIFKRVKNNEIGSIINIQTNEHVSYHHMGVSFVRGKWRNEKVCGSKMLLAKCCHDIDLIMWLQQGVRPSKVVSFGSNIQFNKDNAPKDAGTRCMVDCAIEETCLYSAKKHYINYPDRWSFYVWDCFKDDENPTIEQKINSLKTDNIYGKCIYKCDNTTVDHQSVVLNFENGSTATHNMIGGTPAPRRSIHIVGTTGEIFGTFEEEMFTVRKINSVQNHEYDEEVVRVGDSGDTSGEYGGHGGGDGRLANDFIDFISGDTHSDSCTSIEQSLYGHLATFRADKSREKNTIENIICVLDGKGY